MQSGKSSGGRGARFAVALDPAAAALNASSHFDNRLLNDDVIARTPGWDIKIATCFSAFPDEILLVHVNDTVFQIALCTFPIVSRTFCNLAGGHADHTWPRRLAELTRPDVLILDDFAMRELTAQQADDLYELISDRAQHGRSLITTSNRSPVDWYTLFPNPVVAESLLDRLINTSHQIVMNGPSYRPNKRPGRTNSTSTPTTK